MRILPLEGADSYEPVTVQDFLDSRHIDDAEGIIMLRGLIASAVEATERAARRCIGLRRVEFLPPCGCWGAWYFPVAPVQRLDGLAVLDDSSGEWQDVPLDSARLWRGHDEPVLQLRDEALRARSFRVRATVGYERRTEAMTLRQAVLLLAGEWYDAGITVSDLTTAQLSMGYERLIRQARYRRPAEVGP